MLSEYNFRDYNFKILLSVLALNGVGLMVINSAVGGDRSYINRQLIGLFGGLMVALILSVISYRYLLHFTGLIYLACVGILLAVHPVQYFCLHRRSHGGCGQGHCR